MVKHFVRAFGKSFLPSASDKKENAWKSHKKYKRRGKNAAKRKKPRMDLGKRYEKTGARPGTAEKMLKKKNVRKGGFPFPEAML